MKNKPAKRNILTIALIALCICMNLSASAQRKWKDYLITGSSMLASGMIDGTIESISFHYDTGFKPRFSNCNDQFWNPQLSWKNKYKNGDCCQGPKFMGSTNMFVCATDGYHMLRTSKRAIDTFTLVYYLNKSYCNKELNKKKWKNMVTDFLVLTAIRCVGFNLTYNLAFNPHRNYLQN